MARAAEEGVLGKGAVSGSLEEWMFSVVDRCGGGTGSGRSAGSTRRCRWIILFFLGLGEGQRRNIDAATVLGNWEDRVPEALRTEGRRSGAGRLPSEVEQGP